MIYVPKHTFTSVIFVKHFYANYEARVNALHPSYNLQYYPLSLMCITLPACVCQTRVVRVALRDTRKLCHASKTYGYDPTHK